MSFYGNVTYYLSNAFSRIIYKNDGVKTANNITAPKAIDVEEQYALTPENRKDDTYFKTGNKWLIFSGNQVDREVILYHTVSDNFTAASNEVEGYDYTKGASGHGGSAGSPNPISWGDTLVFPKIEFDNAGHITNASHNYLKLPIPAGEQNINNIMLRLAQLEVLVTNAPGDASSDNSQTVNPDPDNDGLVVQVRDLKDSLEYIQDEISNAYLIMGLDVKDEDNTIDPIDWEPSFGNGRDNILQSTNQNYEYISLLVNTVGTIITSVNGIIDEIQNLHTDTDLSRYKISTLTPNN